MGKISKEISKLAKVPHPQSRKAAQLVKKIIKNDHRQKTKQAHSIKTNVVAEKYLWFQNFFSEITLCTPEVIQLGINKYLARFDEELEQIQLKHEIGGKRNRQHANREDIIRMTKSNEEQEYNTCGIELPDVLNPKQFKFLKTWNGELRYLQNFKLARFSNTRLQSLIFAKSHKKSSADGSSTVTSEKNQELSRKLHLEENEGIIDNKQASNVKLSMECE